MHNLLIAIGAALSTCAAAVLFAKDVTSATVPIVLATNTETIAATGAVLTVEPTTGKAAIKGYLTLTIGTNTTAVTLRIYRNLNGALTLISNSIAQAGNFVVGSPAQFVVQSLDTLTNVGTAQYSMTVQQIGASANGSITTAVIETEILSG